MHKATVVVGKSVIWVQLDSFGEVGQGLDEPLGKGSSLKRHNEAFHFAFHFANLARAKLILMWHMPNYR